MVGSSRASAMSDAAVDVVVLDAMGVIYRSGDDEGELLVPFVQKHGTVHDVLEIERVYTRASRGEMPARELWRRLGVDPAMEDAYLAQHALMDGAVELVDVLVQRGYRVACLSNDVSEWSLKLRKRFDLDARISTWVISGDVGSRKPDRAIYDALAQTLAAPFDTMILFDDRPKNLRAAAECGMRTLLVGADATADASLPRVARLLDALVLLQDPRR
jgi:putative hydrolase of the HAD superfamily